MRKPLKMIIFADRRLDFNFEKVSKMEFKRVLTGNN